MKINFNLISMLFGAGVVGVSLKYYSIYPVNELLMIAVMGGLIWVMSFIMYRDIYSLTKPKVATTSKNPLNLYSQEKKQE